MEEKIFGKNNFKSWFLVFSIDYLVSTVSFFNRMMIKSKPISVKFYAEYESDLIFQSTSFAKAANVDMIIEDLCKNEIW